MPASTIDYHTHILIGVERSGRMTVIHHWSHVPRQAEVEDQIGKAPGNPYAKFLLCTPTSILPQPDKSAERPASGPFR